MFASTCHAGRTQLRFTNILKDSVIFFLMSDQTAPDSQKKESHSPSAHNAALPEDGEHHTREPVVGDGGGTGGGIPSITHGPAEEPSNTFQDIDLPQTFRCPNRPYGCKWEDTGTSQLVFLHSQMCPKMFVADKARAELAKAQRDLVSSATSVFPCSWLLFQSLFLIQHLNFALPFPHQTHSYPAGTLISDATLEGQQKVY